MNLTEIPIGISADEPSDSGSEEVHILSHVELKSAVFSKIRNNATIYSRVN